MTQYLLSVHYTGTDADEMSPEDQQKAFKQVDAVNAEMQTAGVWVFGGGLHPPEIATVVRTEGGTHTTTDGPFPETKEQLGGFWIIEAADLDAALEWARKSSVACMGPVEVRPFQDEPEA
jgi:hypothetical protein